MTVAQEYMRKSILEKESGNRLPEFSETLPHLPAAGASKRARHEESSRHSVFALFERFFLRLDSKACCTHLRAKTLVVNGLSKTSGSTGDGSVPPTGGRCANVRPKYREHGQVDSEAFTAFLVQPQCHCCQPSCVQPDSVELGLKPRWQCLHR